MTSYSIIMEIQNNLELKSQIYDYRLKQSGCSTYQIPTCASLDILLNLPGPQFPHFKWVVVRT